MSDNTNIGIEALRKRGLHLNLNRTETIHLVLNFNQRMKFFQAQKVWHPMTSTKPKADKAAAKAIVKKSG